MAVVRVDEPCLPVKGLSALPHGMELHRMHNVLACAFVEAVRYGDKRVVRLLASYKFDAALRAARWDAAQRTLQFDAS